MKKRLLFLTIFIEHSSMIEQLTVIYFVFWGLTWTVAGTRVRWI